MKNLIYQIGRLDRNVFKKIKFPYNGKDYEEELSGFAINKIQKNSELILIYPVSLLLNINLFSSGKCKIENSPPDYFTKKMEEVLKEPDKYLENPEEFLRFHPHNKSFSFFVIPSIGFYRTYDKSFDFKEMYDDIVLKILVDMIERSNYGEDDVELNVDISSGQNIYISALLDAARHFYVFYKLRRAMKDFKFFLWFSDPILGREEERYNLYKKQISYKVFFSSPLKYHNEIENYTIARKFYENNREDKDRLQKILENFAIIFSSIKNNTPLVVYHFKYHEEEVIRFFIKKFIMDLKNKLKNYRKTIFSDEKEPTRDDYVKIILMFGFYSGIIEILDEHKIKNYKYKDGVELNKIKEVFEKIYEKFGLGLNIKFLGNEISNIMENFEKYKSSQFDKSSFDPRNFFAHSGLERTITEFYEDEVGSKKLVKYYDDPEIDKKIKSTLLKEV